MKKAIFYAALVSLTLSTTPAFADDAHHPEQDKKTAPAKSDKPAGATKKQTDKEINPMQVNMKKMQAQMEKIHKATDPKDRQKLMQEHMQSMQDGMKMMHGMGGEMMQNCDMADGKGMKSHMMGGDMMEKRMEMMQMMMEQMKQHQDQQESIPMAK